MLASPSRFARPSLAAALLMAGSALAADLPATPEGAQKLQAFLAKYLPASPAGAPALVTVASVGSDYRVSADLNALTGLFKTRDVTTSYDPANLIYKLTEQDDGNWRLVQDSFPKVVSRAGDMTTMVDISNSRLTLLVDPALAWWRSGSASADKGVITMKGPRVDETIDFGFVKGDYTTTIKPDGSVSSAVKDEINDIGVKVTQFGEANAPQSVSARLGEAVFHVGVDGLKSRKVFDLWSLLAAHRADIAQHEKELKDLLKAILAPGLRLAEGAEAAKVLIGTPYGAVALLATKVAVGVDNDGPQSAIEAAVGLEGLSLPVGLAPPNAADLMPSRIDVAATLKGIDITAAAEEAIADMRLGGDGPTISDDDSAKVSAALLSAGPMRLELAPSHVVAPAVDADVQGSLRYAVGLPSGSMTIRMRGFDKTMAAVKALGTDTEAKAIPALALAKGLAKTESDGSLSWLIELAEDRSIRVNGIPLGKAPQ